MDLHALFDLWLGSSDWDDILKLPEHEPVVGRLVNRLMPSARLSRQLSLTDEFRAGLQQIAAGTIPIEAQTERSTAYRPVSLEWEFGWNLGRVPAFRLVAIDRDGHDFGPVYFRPREAGARSGEDTKVVYATGTPGRPTSKHLVEAELRQRYAKGERHPAKRDGPENLKRWATLLVSWLKQKHPEAPSMKLQTAENAVRGVLRKLETAPPKKSP